MQCEFEKGGYVCKKGGNDFNFKGSMTYPVFIGYKKYFDFFRVGVDGDAQPMKNEQLKKMSHENIYYNKEHLDKVKKILGMNMILKKILSQNGGNIIYFH